MKKIDKLVIKAFIKPFIVVLSTVEFLFIIRFIVLYFSELFGKDFGVSTYFKLLGLCAIITLPYAMPLGILVASLMCFGNLGEFSELTALKATGTPLWRILASAAIICFFISGVMVYFNSQTLVWANFKFYRLFYDIRSTKPALNIKPGVFYKEIPGYTLRIQKKYPDNISLKGVLIYEQIKNNGNKHIILADSCRMYTILNQTNLVLELYKGTDYQQVKGDNDYGIVSTKLLRTHFEKSKVVMSLNAFGKQRTEEEQYKHHAPMKTLSQLQQTHDSLLKQIAFVKKIALKGMISSYIVSRKSKVVFYDNLVKRMEMKQINKNNNHYPIVFDQARSNAKNQFSLAESNNTSTNTYYSDFFKNNHEWHVKISRGITCFILFLIGASLGCIVRKGGMGMPILIAILFYIFMYVLSINTDKLVKEGILIGIATWIPNLVLLGIGLFFLYGANQDSFSFRFNFSKENFIHLFRRQKKV